MLFFPRAVVVSALEMANLRRRVLKKWGGRRTLGNYKKTALKNKKRNSAQGRCTSLPKKKLAKTHRWEISQKLAASQARNGGWSGMGSVKKTADQSSRRGVRGPLKCYSASLRKMETTAGRVSL